jgi:importin-4
LIPGIFGVIGRAVEANNEEFARHLFDIVETLLILETPLLGKHIPDLVQFTLQVGGNSNADAAIQIMGLNALNWTVQ